MQRIVAALGTLAAAGLLALTIAPSASAATGRLTINGKVYVNPHGCYTSDIWPISVINGTDQAVVILNTTDCRGGVDTVVLPGRSTVSEYGAGIYIQ
ncbi:hypothetical protein [Streptosporangium sp. NBC_01756]|uniref:hypothetical protein n=1 Tax=Streptosporangium sp. NBC_01756 TaxID=2975950 RepID=UPI002DD81B46|nr:hypothetical protein [Streptosporangium sp. NBC_01756]WSC83744.1 hypothetical protein OIE48_25455 [Streptosporangium sp. NBC_01756]